MNTVNQTFDWSRFTATLRKELVENKRGILFTIIGIYGLLTMIMIIGNLITHQPDFYTEPESNYLPQIMVGTMVSLVICISASLAFKNLKSKTGRTYLLTSPSSTFEKFLVNVLVYVVGTIVAYFACAQLADLTRIAALWWFKSDSFIVPGPINFLNSISETVRNIDELENVDHITSFMSIAMWIGLIANAGLFLLGSVIWPRLSALKTFAALYTFEFVVFLIALPIVLAIGDMEAFALWFLDFVSGGRFSISMIIWTCTQAIIFFGLAWYIFKHKDVVSLKWWK